MQFIQNKNQLGSTTMLSGLLAVMLTAQTAMAMPEGGQVVGGNAAISGGGNVLNVNQSSQNAVINWNSFNVGGGETVNFFQPNSSSNTLNRVIDSRAPSQIFGRINANGNVVIVNTHGVLFGGGAEVNVGGLIATNSNITDANFMAGNYLFDQAGSADATIQNDGKIKIADGGLALLAGPKVINNGLIEANLGTVQLASGSKFTVDLYGDGLLSLEASDDLNQQLVKNSGKIKADGGKVLLTTAAAKNTVNSLINMDGIIQANSVGTKNGRVVLFAAGSNAVKNNVAADKGKLNGNSTTLVGGKIEAASGEIGVFADHVAVLSGATLDVSGNKAGEINVGGNFQGNGTNPSATITIIQENSNILANALVDGNGGNVTIWSDNYTNFAGNIEAKGGSNSGNGGMVETSGKITLDANGIVDASAANGVAGTWLLDPNNITISNKTSSNVTGNPNFTTTGNNGVVSVSSIQTNLNKGTNVVITTGSAGSNNQDGDITIASDIEKTSGSSATLTLNAADDIIFNNDIIISSSSNKLGVNLNANTDGKSGGAVIMKSGSGIYSNGGDVNITGYGNSNSKAGVDLYNATISASGGNVSITGTGYATNSHANYGVEITNDSEVRTSGNGSVTINGTGGGNGNSDDNYGVYIDDSTVAAVNGKLSISGFGGGENSSSSTDNYGVLLSDDANIISTGSGEIILTAVAGGNKSTSQNNYGLVIDDEYNDIGGDDASGNITLVADTIYYDDYYFGYDNLEVETSGKVTLKPYTDTTTIGVSGASGTLNISDDLLETISASSIEIGSTAQKGNITANSHSWNAPVTLLGDTANININGTQTMGNRKFVAHTKSGNLVIGSSGGVSSTKAGDAIILATNSGNFTNNRGANALYTPNGRWLVYSTNPTSNVKGGLVNEFVRYSCTFGGNCPAIPTSGDGFLYSYSPILTVNPNAASTTYGSVAPTLTSFISGYIEGDATLDLLSGSALVTTPYVLGNNAGLYDIIAAAGSLSSAMGYTIQGSTLVDGLTVNRKGLIVSANAQTKEYGDADPELTYTYEGLVNGDESASFTGGLSRVAGENVADGPFDILRNNLEAIGNYIIEGYNGEQLIITPATLTVTADEQTKEYGESDPELSYTIDGVKKIDFIRREDGDDREIGFSFGFRMSGNLSRDLGENVGLYGINLNNLSAGGNYVIEYVGANLEITPATLNVIADNQNAEFGAAIPELTFQSSGFKFKDGTEVFEGLLETLASAGSPAGIYDINQGSLNAGRNYVINYLPGLLTINAPAIDKDLVNTTNEQTQGANVGGGQGTNQGTLLSLVLGGGNGGGGAGGNPLANLEPASGNNPANLNDLEPASGGNGGSNNNNSRNNVVSLIQCDITQTDTKPCEI